MKTDKQIHNIKTRKTYEITLNQQRYQITKKTTKNKQTDLQTIHIRTELGKEIKDQQTRIRILQQLRNLLDNTEKTPRLLKQQALKERINFKEQTVLVYDSQKIKLKELQQLKKMSKRLQEQGINLDINLTPKEIQILIPKITRIK